ncbi:unnamed protein product [Miscanthus lutarioriparius]|uniref:SHSP domain-containing protein n=1 Tax=Miscanthus lutarioriparius TaxID=422564 RepID=A0A811MV41_9POAL|nr:unnamed protein product [Miscanthus lutarioriparius]
MRIPFFLASCFIFLVQVTLISWAAQWLSGYKKEHIRVQMVHSHRRLIVRGERPVDGNRWSRFRLELRVPDGCDAKAIHAKFDSGVVRVTMPGVLPEPVPVIDSVTGGTGKQQEPPLPSPPPKQHASTAAVAGDVQDGGGDRDRAARRGQEDDKHETPRKQEARQRVLSSSAKDAAGGSSGSGSGDDTGGVGEVTAASPSARQGYGFLHSRRMATTVLGVVLVLISLGIYVKYSLWP